MADEKYVNRQLNASKLLSEDYFLKKFPRISDSSFTGVPLEDLKEITSVEAMANTTEEANKPKLTFFQKLYGSLGGDVEGKR